jgi:hypothetical protein
MKKITRTNPYLLIILGTVLVTISGCSEDFFNRQAGDRITPDQHYKSQIDAEISMYGAISSLQDLMPKMIILDGLRSDMMDVTPYTGADLRAINDQVFTPGNPFTNPADLYKVVINLNEILAHIDDLVANEREFDPHVTHYYIGALLAMRAWSYFTIVRLFGEAAYIDDNLTELPTDLSQNKLTKEVMIDTLINQLIPYVYDPDAGIERVELDIPYYVNTKGILGELYLEKNDYANAAIYLKMACESYLNNASRYKVDRTYQEEAWATIFLNAESQQIENISFVPFSSNEGQFNPLAGWLGHTFDYVVKPSEVLIDSFMAQVPAAGPVGDPFRGLGVSFGVDTISKTSETDYVTESYITKYAVDQNDPFSTDIIISRAADLHLLLAEAYNRMGDEESQYYALMLLNAGVNKENPKPAPFAKWRNNLGVRGRAYLLPNEVPEAITGEARTRMIEDLIISERALELAFEGKRWFDLVRIAERRGEPEFLADKVAAKFEGTPMYNDIHTKLMNPANWYLPAE